MKKFLLFLVVVAITIDVVTPRSHHEHKRISPHQRSSKRRAQQHQHQHDSPMKHSRSLHKLELLLKERQDRGPGVPSQLIPKFTKTKYIESATTLISIYADPLHLDTLATTLYSLLFQTQKARVLLVSFPPNSAYTEDALFRVLLDLRKRGVKEVHLGKIYFIETEKEWGSATKVLGALQLFEYMEERRVFWNGDSLLVWEQQGKGWQHVQKRVHQYKSTILFSTSRPPRPISPIEPSDTPFSSSSISSTPPPPPSFPLPHVVFQRIIVCESGGTYPPTFIQTLLEASHDDPDLAIGFQGWRVLPSYRHSYPVPLPSSSSPPKTPHPHLIDGNKIDEVFSVGVVTGVGGFVVKREFFGNVTVKELVKGGVKGGDLAGDIWISGELAKQDVMRVVTPYRGTGLWEKLNTNNKDKQQKQLDEDEADEVIRSYKKVWEDEYLHHEKKRPHVGVEIRAGEAIVRLFSGLFGGGEEE